MTTIIRTGIKELVEMGAVTAIVFQYCGVQVLLHNLKRIIAHIPERAYESEAEITGTTSSFLTSIIEDIQHLQGTARKGPLICDACAGVREVQGDFHPPES